MPKSGSKHCQHVALPMLSSDPPVFVWLPLEQPQPYAHIAGHFSSGLQICSFLQWTALNHHIAQTLKLENAATLHHFLIILATHQLPHLADPPTTHTICTCLVSCLSKSLPLTCPFHDELLLFFKSHTDSISDVYVVLRDISVLSLYPFMLIW